MKNLEQWHEALLAMGCAEAVAHMVSCGSKHTSQQFHKACEIAWISLGEKALPQTSLSQRFNLHALPEAHEDDSYSADYYVMLALSVLDYALHLIGPKVREPYLEWAEGAARDLYTNVDGVMASPRAPLILNPDAVGIITQLEGMEVKRQQEARQLLMRELPRGKQLSAIRMLSRQSAADMIEPLLPFERKLGQLAREARAGN